MENLQLSQQPTMVPFIFAIIASKRMRESLPYLQVLVKSKLKLRKVLIYNVAANVITAICERSLNLLKGATRRFKSVAWHATRNISVLWPIKKCRENGRNSALIKKVGVIDSILTPGFKCTWTSAGTMKHAKRMVSVPENALHRYEQKQRLETPPILANMMR